MKRHTRNSYFTVALLLTGIAGCYEKVTPCDDSVGVCPRPPAGVFINELGLAKSSWIEDANAQVLGDGTLTTLCSGDLDRTPGDEILFQGDNGFLVLSPDAISPQVYSRVPVFAPYVRFIDIEGDGNVEYLELDRFDGVRLWDHSGIMVWEVIPDFDAAPPFWSPQVLWLDIDGDARLEFLVGDHRGVQVLTADGNTLLTIGTLPYWSMKLANLDEDDELELVTLDYDFPSPPPGQFHRLTTWNLDGTQVGTFSSPDDETNYSFEFFSIHVDPAVQGLERIKVDCKLFDPMGNEVGIVPLDQDGYCYQEREEPGQVLSFRACTTSPRFEVDPLMIGFDPAGATFRVNFTFSFERVDWAHSLQAGTYYNPRRTILRIFDDTQRLVYHEAISSRSGPGSFVVIPSSADSGEVLLVADDDQVLAYALPSGAPRN